MKRGKFIVIDGTDCSGKATQTNLLVERLNSEGSLTKKISFPRYDTPTGRIVGGPYLGKPEISPCWFPQGSNLVDPKIACLYYAADRRASRETILSILESGKNLVSDRYVEANMGHQGGKARRIKDLKSIIDFIEKLEYDLLELPKPDIVLFLYTPYKIGMKLKRGRSGEADGHESNPKHLKNAEKAYLQIANWRNWKKISCVQNGKMRTIEEINEEVYKIVKFSLEGS